MNCAASSAGARRSRARLAPKPPPKPKTPGESPAARAALHAGHAYQSAGLLAAARAKFAHAARLGLVEARVEIALVDAEMRALAGDAAGSASAARAALAASPTAAQSQRAAIFLQKAGRPAEAARVFDALLAREPGRASLLSDRGIARFLAGDAAGAERDLRAALAIDPKNEAARSSLNAVIAGRRRLP